MPEKLTIGLDVGGTKMAFVVADRAGNICEETTLPTLQDSHGDSTLDCIAEQLNDFLARYDNIEGIGIGVPGPVDSKRGIALNAVNLLWRDVPVRDGIEQRLQRNLPVYVENDVNVGAIGEQLFGIAKESPNYVYIAIGTGLGGAVMINGRLMRGVTSAEMEVGHVSLDPVNGRQCTCGQRGCVEMSISGKGFVANALQHYADYPQSIIPRETLTTYEIIKAARNHDALGEFVLDEAAYALGIACAWCTNIFNPNWIIIGGGIAHAAYDLLIDKTLETMRQRTLPQCYDAVTVSLSQLTNAALGASALVWYFQHEQV